ncbi:hypothetical protein [Actinobacillus pleuropneumoniae]|uniref:hypothetical protein n=1 Tax=Actinobacillus pleuropneumoniae TaxID=715 RepID=UPI003B019C56
MSKFWLLVSFPFITFFVWIVGDKIGWSNIGFFFFVLLVLLIIFIVLEDRKFKKKLENDPQHNEYIAKLKQEIQRPIIQAELAKRANSKDYDPLFPNTEDEEVTLSDVVGSYFDTIRAAIPTEENPLKAKITYTNPKGENFDINLEIKPKSQK